jgi:hypothetical protein
VMVFEISVLMRVFGPKIHEAGENCERRRSIVRLFIRFKIKWYDMGGGGGGL